MVGLGNGCVNCVRYVVRNPPVSRPKDTPTCSYPVKLNLVKSRRAKFDACRDCSVDHRLTTLAYMYENLSPLPGALESADTGPSCQQR